jgi:hypothetical protein
MADGTATGGDAGDGGNAGDALAMPVKMVMQRLPETPMAETVDIAGAVSADSNRHRQRQRRWWRQLAVTPTTTQPEMQKATQKAKRKAMAGTAAMPGW